jgi:hypothetical protein
MVHRIRIRRQGPHNRDRWCCQLRMALRHRQSPHRRWRAAMQGCAFALVHGAPEHDGLLMLLLCTPRDGMGKGGRQ